VKYNLCSTSLPVPRMHYVHLYSGKNVCNNRWSECAEHGNLVNVCHSSGYESLYEIII